MFLFKWIYVKIYGQECWDEAMNPTRKKKR